MNGMKKKIVIASMGMCAFLATYAQQQDTTLVRTVVVENQYNPTVMDASKINVLPKVEEPTVPKAHIDYANSVRPVASWVNQSMNPIVRDWTPDAAYRGYLRAGYGNNGNVDARLGYLWDISKKDRLNVEASLNGWNGELTDLNDMDWKSRLYNTRVGLDYKHAFKKVDLMLGGAYRSQVFNYMNARMYNRHSMNRSTDGHFRRQHQTMANAHLGIASTDKDMSIQFMGEVGMNLFKQKYPTNIAEGSENNFYLKGDVWKPFNDQRFGLAWDFNTYSMDDMKGTTSLELNPYYGYENDDWRIRLGAHVDWWSGIDDEVNFSPDVNVEYIFSDCYVLYAKAGGGRENKSLMELTEFTPYWTLSHPYILPTYMSLDAAIGLKASPMNGLWFNLTGGYQIRENDLFWKLVDGSASYLGFEQGKSKVAYGSAELKYDYKDLFDLGLKATYYHWKGDKMEGLDQYAEERLLALKPEMELNAEVGFKPVQGLRINAGYEYVKRAEEIYDPISNLYVGADYALMKNLSIFAKANNLLNKEYVRVDAYPAQKLNFLAGLSLQF
jgi:hypothetical protein